MELLIRGERIFMKKIQGILLKYAVLIGSSVLIAVGVMSGDVEKVLSKAIAICMECIGIG